MKKLLIKFFIFNVFIIYSGKAITQTNYYDIDSLKKLLIAQKEDTERANTLDLLSGDYFHNDDYENTLKSAQVLLLLSIKLHYVQGIVYGYADIAQAYALKQDRISEFKYFDSSLVYAKKNGNAQNIIDAYDYMSSGYELIGDYGRRLECDLNSLKIKKQTGDRAIIADGYMRLARSYFALSDDFNGKINVASALELYKRLHNKQSIATCYIFYGENYLNQGEYDKALGQYYAALQVFKEDPINLNIPNIYSFIGNVYKSRGDSAYNKHNKPNAIKNYLVAEKNYQISLHLMKSLFDWYPLASCFSDVGFININIGNFDKAKAYLDSSLSIYKSKGLKTNVADVYYGLSKIDSMQGNFTGAYEHYKLFKTYYDSGVNEKNNKKAIQVQMQYDFDNKEAISKAEQEKKDADTKRVKTQQYFIIAGLGVIVLAVIIISLIQFRNNKHKQKANLLLERQKQKVEVTLSELRSTQSQLIQSEKMASLGELTAGIAHEIQNPLNFVNNFSEVNNELISEMREEIAKKNFEEVDQIAKDVQENEQKINHHGKRADAIVKGMLQHSRSSVGVKEPTDINALADEYLRLSYHGLRAKDNSFNATMKTDLDASIEKINIIPQDIGRMFLNLYNNAFYAIAEKIKQQANGYEPIISVSTKKIDDSITITVSDNGNGIPQKVVDKIFQPFFTTKPTGQGTGLGLSLSYDIIKAHGGEIKVNTNENEFTEFVIQLPIST